VATPEHQSIFGNVHNTAKPVRSMPAEWQEHYAMGRQSWNNPYNHNPPSVMRRGCWARGYAEGCTGGNRQAPYRCVSSHGATWGWQACQAYGAGYSAGRAKREAQYGDA